VIAPINDAVALDVEIMLESLPKKFREKFADRFPLEATFIDRENPYENIGESE